MWPADSFSIPHPPRNRKRPDGVWGRGRAWTNRASLTLTEWAFADAEPREPVSFHLRPRKQPFIVPHGSPGVRAYPLSCRGCFHARLEYQFHRKQSWQAGQEYMHSYKMLVGYWNPNPGKAPPPAAFPSPLTGWLRVLPDGFKERPLFPKSVKSPVLQCPQGRVAAPPVERLQGSVSGPCRGIGGGPQQADFTGFRQGENRKVCTALHCLRLLF